MKISIIGTGYVGLPTACAFAKWGHEVVCVDTDRVKTKQLQSGKATIYEKGLQELLNEVKRKINFTTDYLDIVGSELVIVAVGTPMDKDGKANLTYIRNAIQSINEYAKSSTVAIKSTVPVGTCKAMGKYLPGGKIASMPEFLREGFALDDIFNPDRIIVGTSDYDVFGLIMKAYPENMRSKIHHIKSCESSEMIKYASNAFLAIKIHYINEIADLCEKVGADVKDVAYGMGLDSRIGNKFLQAGPGYGGSCFPKDTNAIYALAESKDVNLSLVGTAINGNRKRQRSIAHKINTYDNFLKGIPGNRTIAVLGLSFKPGTDDVRESPAINIINNLTYDKIYVYDPKAMNNAKEKISNNNVIYATSVKDCLNNADVVVIATDWKEFENIYDYIRPQTMIIDLRNMLDINKIQLLKCSYKGIGR